MMSKIVSVILLFILSTFVYAIDFKDPSYDMIPITPMTWQEVDLSYIDIIKGKSYPAEIKLLRPIEWLEENGMDKVGNHVNLSIPEFGVINVHATVIAIKPTKLDTSKTDWSKIDSRPVIGTFKRYAPVVKTYIFKDLSTGEISTINATPNHPFYVKNKHEFVPIEDVEATDKLVNSRGQAIKLICSKGQSNHCGMLYNKNAKPVLVYNLEVYQRHIYFIGKANILVHNIYPFPENGPMNLTNRAREESIKWMKNEEKITVYRYDSRSPREINKLRGFHPRSLESDGVRGHVFSSEYNSDAMSGGVSTTTDINVARSFFKKHGHWKGYLYKLELEPYQAIDMDRTFMNLYSMPSAEAEHLVIGSITNKQIIDTEKMFKYKWLKWI